MILKLLGLRRGFTAILNRGYPHGKLLMSMPPTSCSRLPNCGQVMTAVRSYRCDAHMNELPVPCLPWEPWYSDKQSFYNKVLAAGILWWLFSFGMMLYTDSIYLNWGPPKQPGPPSDMLEECDDSV